MQLGDSLKVDDLKKMVYLEDVIHNLKIVCDLYDEEADSHGLCGDKYLFYYWSGLSADLKVIIKLLDKEERLKAVNIPYTVCCLLNWNKKDISKYNDAIGFIDKVYAQKIDNLVKSQEYLWLCKVGDIDYKS